MKKLLSILLVVVLVSTAFATMALTACTPEEPCTAHVDADSNGKCDVCGEQIDEGGQTPPEDEWTLDPEPGMRQVTIYWNSKSVDYSTCDVWIWYGEVAGKGYLFHECSYGVKTMVNVPESVDQVGFIVRKNCSEPGGSSWGNATKDVESDRFITLTGANTVIYLKPGDPAQYESFDGGKTLIQITDFTLAGMTSFTTIKYNISPAAKLALEDITVRDGDRVLPLVKNSATVKSATGIVTVGERLDLSKTYTMEIKGFGIKTVMPTKIFDSTEFVENYVYDGDDLGATIGENGTTFKLWAPTASAVVLNLFAAGDGGEAIAKISMTKGEKGVWEHFAEGIGHGTYYTYSVTTSAGEQEAVDPYARSAGVNGNRGMVIDLSLTDPDGFDTDTFVDSITTYSDAILWEVHVRDFTNKIATATYPGKFLGFTETGLTNSHGMKIGLDYVAELGVTHVHLLPVYDYATVDESTPEDEFNWGYDPKNYNVPEGSYSTNPFDGAVRVLEFKKMVQALHSKGLGVVMDVVYNHTHDANSSLNKIVPYYYYRYTASGANGGGSGCGNETASERAMYRKFMVDSVSYWMSEYHLDGFRFDLMALHDLTTMQEIEKAVHAINPKALIYGEGWTGGTSELALKPANQANINQITATPGAAGAVSVFNDVIRDGVKGSVFDKAVGGYVNGNTSPTTAKSVGFGMQGGAGLGYPFMLKDQRSINYVSAHDNNTLWDKLLLTCPSADEATRLAMNRMAAAIVMVSQGTPFMQAGEEMLRTKDGDENSYKSSDAINNIDWEALQPDNSVGLMVAYYKALMNLRRSYSIFTDHEVVATVEIATATCIVLTLAYPEESTDVTVIVNPNPVAYSFDVPGTWNVFAQGALASTTPLGTVTDTVEVEARSVTILMNVNQ